MALRMLAVFWVVMSAAELATEYLNTGLEKIATALDGHLVSTFDVPGRTAVARQGCRPDDGLWGRSRVSLTLQRPHNRLRLPLQASRPLHPLSLLPSHPRA